MRIMTPGRHCICWKGDFKLYLFSSAVIKSDKVNYLSQPVVHLHLYYTYMQGDKHIKNGGQDIVGWQYILQRCDM